MVVTELCDLDIDKDKLVESYSLGSTALESFTETGRVFVWEASRAGGFTTKEFEKVHFHNVSPHGVKSTTGQTFQQLLSTVMFGLFTGYFFDMDGGADSSFSASSAQNEPASEQLQEWMREQGILKSRLILHDDFSWTLPPKSSDTTESSKAGSSLVEEGNWLRYVGGVDLSFSKTDSSIALGALIILDMHSMKVVYEDFDLVQLKMPYIPGFLAFRESPVILNLLEKMGNSPKNLYPQLLMVDGNGILHPRGFGLASHLGVVADIPTIGVGKNLHHVDGLSDAEVRLEVSKSHLSAGDAIPLIGRSGTTWGVAFKSHEGSTKPIFISIGHRISLETATAVVQRCCQYRVPEPVRQADMRSRERLRLMNHEST